MATLYHVALRWVKSPVDVNKVTPAFNACGDWARLNAYNWYIWSNLSSAQIYDALRPHFHTDDSIAIFAIDPTTGAGWAPQWFWDWVRSGGTQSPNALMPPAVTGLANIFAGLPKPK